MGRLKNRESEEMYLETILLLRRRKANVRAVDVCEELGYVKSCVSRGVNFIESKRVCHDRSGKRKYRVHTGREKTCGRDIRTPSGVDRSYYEIGW